MNTFGMKVSCACFVEYDSVEDLKEIFSVRIHDLPQPVFHIGGGSNLLFTKDFPGTIFHSNLKFIIGDVSRHVIPSVAEGSADRPVKQISPLRLSGFGRNDNSNIFSGTHSDIVAGAVQVEVGSGVIFDDFCAWAAERNLWGPENLSLIPGETGAAAVQNIGAYGVEVKDIISKVNCFDVITGNVVTFNAKECHYAYRDSIFKDTAKGRYIVTSVVFSLSPEPMPRLDYGHIRAAVEEALECPVEEAGERLVPAFIRKTIIEIRKAKLPDPAETGSAGSFFKNPVVPRSAYDKVVNIALSEFGEDCKVPHYDTWSGFVKIPAAWLIEHCGWKGYAEGNVGVYEKQPLVLVNRTGQATPQEIIALEQKIIRSVKDRFDIDLHPEVEHI